MAYNYYQSVQSSGYQYGVGGPPTMPGGQPAYHPTMMMMPNVVQQNQQGHPGPRYQSMPQQSQFRGGFVPGLQEAASLQYQQQMIPVQPRGIQQILVPMQSTYINNTAILPQQYNGQGGSSWQASMAQYPNGSPQQPAQFLPSQPQQNSYKPPTTDHRPGATGYPNYPTQSVVQPSIQPGPMPTPQVPQQQSVEKRERKPLLIVNPNTQEVLNVGDLAKPSATAPSQVVPKDDTRSTSSSIATEFAAKVAATLSHDSANRTVTASSAVPVQPSADALPSSSVSESSARMKPSDVLVVDSSGDRLETVDSETVLQTQLSAVEDTVDAAANIPVPSAVASSCVPDLSTDEAVSVSVSVVDSTLIAPDLQKSVERAAESTPVTTAPISDVTAQQATSEKVIVSSTDTVVASEASLAGHIVAEKVEVTKEIVSSPVGTTTDDSTGKDAKKKNKNKKKDVNVKGKALVSGSEMDAFIDEKQLETATNPVVTTVLAEPVMPGKSVDTDSTISVGSVESISVSSGKSADDTSSSVSSVPVAHNALETDEPVEAAAVGPVVDSSEMTNADRADAKYSEEIPADQDFEAAVESTPDKIVDNDELEENAEEDVDHVAAKIELKYKYTEDQWSPLNPEGKKQYDREFMMQLQNTSFSLRKPDNLPPHLDIVLDEPSPSSRLDVSRNRSIELGRMNSMTAPDFTPGYVKSSPSGSRRPAGQKSASIKRDGPGGGGPAFDQKVINLRLQKDVQLNKSENAWKPQLISKEDVAANELLATQDLYKKVRGILNKLTPQKFQTLMGQVNDLKIDTEERLMGCIDIIFEKAISEPSYSVAYANMAKRMISLNVPKTGTDPAQNQMVTFRTLLLNKCQREFEKDKQDELDMAARQKLIEEADSEDKRKQLLDEQEEACVKSKRRSLGNIRFIGELFKLRMLTETIMHECLFKLLRSDDEDSLECLCQLLTTIGQELDKKESKLQPRMEQYFKQLDALVADRSKVSSRIRFMILDTIDLRKNQWVMRRGTNNPKTIEQIHKEAEEEGQKIKAEMQKAAMDNRNRRSMGVPHHSGTPAGGGEDGWNTVTRPPKVLVDPSRMKLSKQQQVDENIQLGPGGRGLGTWQFGSRGGGKTPATPQSADADRITQVNRYSMLASNPGVDQMDPRNRSSGGRVPASPASGGPGLRPGRDYQGSMSGPPGRAMGPRLSQEKNANMSLRSDRQDYRSPASSRSASREPRQTDSAQRDEIERPTSAMSGSMTQSTGPELSREELERKTKSIIEEYLHLNDLKEATECVKELDSPKSLHLFVYHSLMLNLERSQLARQRTGALLHHLVKNRVLSNSQYVEGLRSVLELAEDMVIDVPCIWTYFSELISPMVEEGGGLPLVSLRNAFQPLLDCSGGDKAGIVMSLVLHDAVHRLGHHQVAELWQQSGLEWSEFVPVDKIDSFLEQNKLEFTMVKSSLPATRTMPIERLQEELTQIFKDDSVEDEKVIDFLQENNGSEVDSKCIRALTNAMCSAALTDGDSQDQRLINVSLVKKRVHLLNKLINGQQNLEIEVLFAVQVFVYKAGVDTSVFPQIFDMLYDEDVVSDVTFMKWKTNHLEGEQIGRGIAMRTLTQFFKWLEEDTTTS